MKRGPCVEMLYMKRQLLKHMSVSHKGPFGPIFVFVSSSFKEVCHKENLFCLSVSASDHCLSPCTILYFSRLMLDQT